MQDSFGNELSVGVVVETFGAYNKCDKAMWVVTNIDESSEISIERLNKDMRKAKTNTHRSWPFRYYQDALRCCSK